MQVDWPHLKAAIERGLRSAENGERGGLRIHCRAAERMVKAVKGDLGAAISKALHQASISIDMSRATENLKEALTKTEEAIKAAGA